MTTRQANALAEKIKKENTATERWEREAAARANKDSSWDGEGIVGGGYGGGGPGYGGGGNSGRGGGSRGGSRGRGGHGDFGDENAEVRGDGVVIDHSTIYDRAERISSPRFVDDGDDIPQYVNRKVVRQVEVPYKRQVKVPVKTRKIVPTRVKKKVRTTKLVEVPAFKMVDETYTEIVEQPAIRNKEVWIKKIVPEKYIERVPVQRTRSVQVPTTVIQEIDDYEVVEVGGSKTVEVDGFRVDEVEDTKVVEVEEMQRYRLKPEADGPARIDAERDIGRGQRSSYSNRRVGRDVYHSNDERVRDVPVDETMNGAVQGMGGMAITSYNRLGSARQQRGSARGRPASAPDNRRRNDRDHDRGRGHHGYKAPRSSRGGDRGGDQGRAPRPVGFKLSETRDGNCIAVTAVTRGSPAEHAGVRKGDLIYHCNNRPTRNLPEFRRVMGGIVGHNMQISVKRLNTQKLMLTIVR